MSDPTDSDEMSTQSTRTVRRRGQYTHARRPGRVKLRVLDGPQAGEEKVIERNRLRVGRSKSADMRVQHDSLSELHFELRLGRTGVQLFDLASKNGTFLLDRRVYHAELHPGDEILAGECRIVLVEVGDVVVEQGAELYDDGLFGISEPILEAFATLERAADTDMHVLIGGDTGVGKDAFAKALHRHSKRRGGPLVVLNCAALPEGLADSELFGHRRGAFTGAEHDRTGVFEQANGSTLLIGEVAELSLPVQAKLLRVLESMEIVRLGDERVRAVDVRVVATTHRDLPTLVEEGKFREDLYFRLAELCIDVPNLRTRGPDDVVYLAKRFLAETNQNAGTSLRLSAPAIEALREHSWRGNIRELRSVIRRLPAFCTTPEVRVENLALSDYQPRLTQLDEIVRTGSLEDIHLAFDRWFLPQVLKDTNGNISAAARRLDVGRKALTKRIADLGIRA